MYCICNAFCLPDFVTFCTHSVNMVAMVIYQPSECRISNHTKFIRVCLHGVTNITDTRKYPCLYNMHNAQFMHLFLKLKCYS